MTERLAPLARDRDDASLQAERDRPFTAVVRSGRSSDAPRTSQRDEIS